MQEVSMVTLNALRTAAANAADEEECVCRILARCRGVIREHVIRCQSKPTQTPLLAESSHPRSEEPLQSAKELLLSVEARLGWRMTDILLAGILLALGFLCAVTLVPRAGRASAGLSHHAGRGTACRSLGRPHASRTTRSRCPTMRRMSRS
jgi:hypothetical protein